MCFSSRCIRTACIRLTRGKATANPGPREVVNLALSCICVDQSLSLAYPPSAEHLWDSLFHAELYLLLSWTPRHVHEVGRGKGEDYTINIPLPPGSGSGAYRAAFDRVVVPALDAFCPQVGFLLLQDHLLLLLFLRAFTAGRLLPPPCCCAADPCFERF